MISTGKGVLKAIETTPSKYIIKEVPFNNAIINDDAVWWDVEKDPLYENGVFIHSKLNPSLVWDAQGTHIIIINIIIHLLVCFFINVLQGINIWMEHLLCFIKKREH